MPPRHLKQKAGGRSYFPLIFRENCVLKKVLRGRIKALYPDSKLPTPTDSLETPDMKLRGAGLSLSKTRAIKGIAVRAIDGTVPSAEKIAMLSDDEIINRLTSIFGIGQRTVEMMLIFNLGRIDVLPVEDYALRSVYS